MRDINPGVRITAIHEFLVPEAVDASLARHASLDFIADCIDSVEPKVQLICAAHKAGVPVISAMGAGGKVDPAQVHVADIVNTHNDRFARYVRKSLRRSGMHGQLTVVYSPEPAVPGSMLEVRHAPGGDRSFKRSYYGTMSYMPAVFGMHAAAYVIGEVGGVNRIAVKRQRSKTLGRRPGTTAGLPRRREAAQTASEVCEPAGLCNNGSFSREQELPGGSTAAITECIAGTASNASRRVNDPGSIALGQAHDRQGVVDFDTSHGVGQTVEAPSASQGAVQTFGSVHGSSDASNGATQPADCIPEGVMFYIYAPRLHLHGTISDGSFLHSHRLD